MSATGCAAVQQSDEMHCAKCRLRWDVNDQDRPFCLPRTASGVPAIPSPPLVPHYVGIDYGAEPAVTVAHRITNERLPFVSALAPDTLHQNLPLAPDTLHRNRSQTKED